MRKAEGEGQDALPPAFDSRFRALSISPYLSLPFASLFLLPCLLPCPPSGAIGAPARGEIVLPPARGLLVGAQTLSFAREGRGVSAI